MFITGLPGSGVSEILSQLSLGPQEHSPIPLVRIPPSPPPYNSLSPSSVSLTPPPSLTVGGKYTSTTTGNITFRTVDLIRSGTRLLLNDPTWRDTYLPNLRGLIDVIDASNSGDFETARNVVMMLLSQSPAELCVIATRMGVGGSDIQNYAIKADIEKLG